jgi:two-component system NarL family sensor kinase
VKRPVGDRAALAWLRLALVVIILVSEQLVDTRQLADPGFFLLLALAAGYGLVDLLLAGRGNRERGAGAFARLQPLCDILLLTVLTYTSGGAYSDVRKAFFVVPLAAAFSERPTVTARWSVVAVLAFSLQAALVGGHPAGAASPWQRMTINQALYLAWTGAAATMLTLLLRRRTSEIEVLAQSRQRLVTQAIEAVERERTRLAGALHDSPLQNLIAARHDLRRAERDGDVESFERLHDAIDTTIAQLREEIFNLHPHVLDHVGLPAALRQVAKRHTRAGELAITIQARGELEAAHRLALFAIGRELLGNAAKHAAATRVHLTLAGEPDEVLLTVCDNGRGIPEGRLRQALLDGHIGLAAVRERVSALGGRFTVDTAPGRGTTVRITLPRTAREEHPADSELVGASSRPSCHEVSERVTSHVTLGLSTR